MNQYELVIQDVRVKKILLIMCNISLLSLVMLLLWGMIEPWMDGGTEELERVADIAQTSVLLLIATFLLWVVRVLLRKIAQMKTLEERVRRKDTDRGRFQVVERIIGFKARRTGDRVGKVYTIYAQHIETGRQIPLRVWQKDVYDKIVLNAVYEIEYIEDYPYALRFERVV